MKDAKAIKSDKAVAFSKETIGEDEQNEEKKANFADMRALIAKKKEKLAEAEAEKEFIKN